MDTEIIINSLIVNVTLINQLVKYVNSTDKGSTPFAHNFEEFYFTNNGTGIKQIRNNLARHHIIDADTYLKPIWNTFINFCTFIRDNRTNVAGNTLLNSEKGELLLSLRAFDKYIEKVKRYANPTDSSNIGIDILQMVVWNPGNLILGPLPNCRSYNDPGKIKEKFIFKDPNGNIRKERMYFIANHEQDYSTLIFGNNNLPHKDIELLPLLALGSCAIKEKLEKTLSTLFTNELTIDIQNVISVAERLQKFWQAWGSLFDEGYLIYEWTQQQEGWYPEHYAFNLYLNDAENKQETINYIRKRGV